MENEYRIVEQFGAFRIEEKRESEHHLDAISLLVLLITRRKIPKYTYWVSSVNQSFATKKEAIDYIPKLNPKYHEISTYFNKQMLEADKELQRVCKENLDKYYLVIGKQKFKIVKPFTFG